MIAAENKVALSYHSVRGLYFLAVVFVFMKAKPRHLEAAGYSWRLCHIASEGGSPAAVGYGSDTIGMFL